MRNPPNNLNFLLIFSIFFQSLITEVSAKWSKEEETHIKSFKSKIKDPFVLTVKTYTERPSFVIPKNRKTTIRKHFISSKYFKSGKVPYLLGELKNDKKAKPLLVYIPGTFSKLFSQMTKDFHLRLVRIGYRVISFENIFYYKAINKGPLFDLFNIKTQAKAYLEAVQKIRLKLFKQGKVNNQVTLIGQSYGGFLASAMFSLDNKLSERLNEDFFTGGLHVYSPPFDFFESIKIFDNLLSKAKQDKAFGSFTKYLLTYMELGKIDDESEITEILRQKALPLFVDYGFRIYIDDTLESINNLKGGKILPKSRKKRVEFLKNLSFTDAFQIVDDVTFDHFKNSQERKLSYWIQKAIQKGRDNIRILSSDDDMINAEVDPNLIDTPHFLTIPHGGHFGYRQMAWFDELLIKSLSLSKTNNLNELKLALSQKQGDQ